jgi:hypothetical protein
MSHITDIRKFRKRQHQYPKFGHTQGEIQKKPANKYIISIQGMVKLRKPSFFLWFPEFHPVFLFFLIASTAAT